MWLAGEQVGRIDRRPGNAVGMGRPHHCVMPGQGLGLGGRVVAITGASRGLGRAVAERLAAEGCDLAVCARNGSPLDDFADELRGRYGVRVYPRTTDVTDHDGLNEFIQQSVTVLGSLYGLVVNAGGSRGRALSESTADDWAVTFQMNTIHAAMAMRATVPHLRGGGSVVLVSSVSGWKPAPPAQYSAAKAAMIHLGACLARELGPDAVRVNVVCPGSMLIPGRRWDRMRTEDPQAFERFAAEFPNGRLVDPGDVASVIAFLLSDQARAVNGACIAVDGGQNAPTPNGY